MSAKNFRRVEAEVDAEGWITRSAYSAWDCEECGAEVRRYRGQYDASCECGAQYNAGGQRLRDDWRDNPAWRYDDVDDMTGYEIEQLRKEGAL